MNKVQKIECKFRLQFRTLKTKHKVVVEQIEQNSVVFRAGKRARVWETPLCGQRDRDRALRPAVSGEPRARPARATPP